MNVRTNLLLPADLVEELDRVAGPRNRSRFVAEAVRYRLKREKLRQAWEQSFGVLEAADYPHWETSEKVVEWVREMRAEVTDPGPDPVPTLSAPPVELRQPTDGEADAGSRGRGAARH